MAKQVKVEITADSSRFEQAMQGAANLSVELVAECGMGENWLSAH